MNHDLNKFNLTRNAIERWPRYYRQLSDSSSDSSTSPVRQPTRSRARRRCQRDHRANRGGMQSCQKEYPVQSKLVKQMKNKLSMEQNQVHPQISIQPNRIEYLSRTL